MTGNAARVGKKAVNRNQSRDAGKQGKQRVEGSARGVREDAVFRDAVVDAQKNVLPSPGRDLRSCRRRPATPDFELCVIASDGVRLLDGSDSRWSTDYVDLALLSPELVE
jgi:hypothetical protein